MDGRFPAARADVASTDNSLVQWTLFSRDDECRVAAAQCAVVAISCSRARRANGSNRPRNRWAACTAIVTGSWWRTAESNAPTCAWVYQPEVLVFLSQGAAPYALAVGSATARRMPIGVLIEELRQRNDPSWQPTLARWKAVRNWPAMRR